MSARIRRSVATILSSADLLLFANLFLVVVYLVTDLRSDIVGCNVPLIYARRDTMDVILLR